MFLPVLHAVSLKTVFDSATNPFTIIRQKYYFATLNNSYYEKYHETLQNRKMLN